MANLELVLHEPGAVDSAVEELGGGPAARAGIQAAPQRQLWLAGGESALLTLHACGHTPLEMHVSGRDRRVPLAIHVLQQHAHTSCPSSAAVPSMLLLSGILKQKRYEKLCAHWGCI